MSHLFAVGTVFLNFKAIRLQGTKPKYFIGMCNADEDDDYVVSFVFNTQNHLRDLKPGCNRKKGKFILLKVNMDFLTAEYTAVMLDAPQYYTLGEIIDNPNIKIIETAQDRLTRAIKNCIDMNNVGERFQDCIRQSFK